MTRVFLILAAAAMTLISACSPVPEGTSGGQIYRIRNAEKLQFRMVDSLNALRQARGLNTVALNAQLNAAAATHSRDMAVQNRPWHFGSDGSSPLERVARAGYAGPVVGETISETYESELETLAAWMDEPTTRQVLMDPAAVSMGFSWHQESNGKIWWTLVLGG